MFNIDFFILFVGKSNIDSQETGIFSLFMPLEFKENFRCSGVYKAL